MARLVIIPEGRLRALIDDAVRQAVEDVLAEATFVDVTVPGSESLTLEQEIRPGEPEKPRRAMMRPPDDASRDERKNGYVIGRA
mgnify:CR=1 FL=1